MTDNNFYRPQPVHSRDLAIDLDGTLAYPTWEPNQKRSIVGAPIPENVAKLHAAIAAGYSVVIHTSRHWGDKPMIEDWLKLNHIPYTQVVCGKILAAAYIDDKAINARDSSWLPTKR